MHRNRAKKLDEWLFFALTLRQLAPFIRRVVNQSRQDIDKMGPKI